jgi:SET domain-containing protein
MCANVIVKKSNIDGKGVFAVRDIKKGEVILEWDISHTLTPKELEQLAEDERKYVSYTNGKYVVMQPPEKFMNHSCDANTYSDNFRDIAKRDIKMGEEITADYSETEVPGFSMKCKCGSKNCRGVIKSRSTASHFVRK